MLELFKAECRRFRWLALGLGLAHLGLLLFFDRVMDPLQQSREIYQAVALTYALIGALLGGFQLGSYVRTNHWIALVHRPLAPTRIAGAIGGAGATILAAAILLPLALFLIAHQSLSPRFIDLKHWLMILSGLLFALIGYLAAAYIALAPRRFGWLIFFVAIIPAGASAVGIAAVALQLLTLIVMGLLVLTMFKPDLSLPPRRIWPLAGTALVLAFGLNRALLLIGDFGFQVLWILTGTHPLNSIPPKGGYVEASRAEAADLMIDGLAGRHDRQANLWRDQIRMSELFELPTAPDWTPVRHQLLPSGAGAFADKKRNILWTFSDDAMAFRGVRQTDMRPVGMLRADHPFAAPPMLGDDNMIISGSDLFQFDEDTGSIDRRLSLAGGEPIVGGPQVVGDSVVLLGDQRLHFLDRRDLNGDELPHPEIASIRLPGPVANIQRIDAIELLDGYLVSFTFGRDTVFGPTRAWQEMIEIDGSGRSHPVAYRPIAQDFPAASRFARYWMSPAYNAMRTGLDTAGTGDVAVWRHEPIRVPTSVWIAAALIALASAAATAALARRRRFAPAEVAAWSAVALVFSLPMAVTFWLLRPRARR